MDIQINYRRIGRHLQRGRKHSGITQEEVAEKFEITGNSYGNIERGSQKPSLQRIVQACILYGIQPGDVLNDCCDELITNNHNNLISNEENHRKQELLCLLDKCSDKTLQLLTVIAQAVCSEVDD